MEIYCKDPIEFADGAIMLVGTFETLKDDPSARKSRCCPSTPTTWP
jgi:hypothetical protein